MNRALIITVGIIIIILVLGIWIYLMLFGTPKDGGEVFANLGFDLSQQSTTITPPVDSTPLDTLVDTQSNIALRQLTTRPVAGFAFASTSAGQAVRYVERGTGHVYEINLESGVENILSRTTIPKVSGAVFSPDANTVALTSYEDYTSSVFVGTIGGNTNLIGVSLQPNAKNIAFSSDNELLYTVSLHGTTKGFVHNLSTLAQSELFSMNYTNLDIGWGSGLDSIYLSTKPSQELEGFIYTTKNNILTPVTPSAYGLSALFSNNFIVTTSIREGSYVSVAIDDAKTAHDLPILTLKEKCVFDAHSPNHIWCAAPVGNTSASFVEDWYKGVVISEDYLWLVDITKKTAQLYADPKSLTGRSIDVKDINSNTEGNVLTFTNKMDHTLWLYDLSVN